LYQIGDLLTIEPDTLVAGGAALARVDGFPIFSINVFPGDRAVVRLFEVKKGFARGELVELLRPSPWRRTMPCPVAGECGGCDWTALRLDKQLDAKRGILIESLRRIGKIREHPPIAVHPSHLNYRLRSRLQRDGDRLGFYATRSNRVVPLVEECEVVGIETAHIHGAAAASAADSSRRPTRPPLHDDEEEIWDLGVGELVGEGELQIGPYLLSTDALFQVNRHLLSTMLRLVTAHASHVNSKRTAIDLYAGVGFFTLPLARLFEQVIAVEGSRASAHYARINSPKNVKVVEAPVERHAARLPEADFVFLDPPRAGTRHEVVDVIAERTREAISWLSCDPVTFARDASRLLAKGWSLASLDLLDLFPNTHHVETLARFERTA
jgi:tRNA/tmRNA/rRNA uracil-C5-methylase (TrmA/RlmC/RlmD family)